MSAPSPPANAASPVNIITQTSVLPGKDKEFGAWQERMNRTIASYRGYLGHQVIPPSPPTQADWVIVQSFDSIEAARVWLNSDDRAKMLAEAQPLLVGVDSIHIVRNDRQQQEHGGVSAIISTKVPPGNEEAYRAWQRKTAVAESNFPGFRGEKIEAPIPGVQDDWVTIISFDTDEHLNAWLNSPERKALVQEAEAFAPDFQLSTMRSGFETWFTFGEKVGLPPPPGWKMNMVVLLAVFPIVFLFGYFVSTPLLIKRGVPFHIALFVGNAVSTVIVGSYLVPRLSVWLRWWLQPKPGAPKQTNLMGIALMVALYLLFIIAFTFFPPS